MRLYHRPHLTVFVHLMRGWVYAHLWIFMVLLLAFGRLFRSPGRVLRGRFFSWGRT